MNMKIKITILTLCACVIQNAFAMPDGCYASKPGASGYILTAVIRTEVIGGQSVEVFQFLSSDSGEKSTKYKLNIRGYSGAFQFGDFSIAQQGSGDTIIPTQYFELPLEVEQDPDGNITGTFPGMEINKTFDLYQTRSEPSLSLCQAANLD
jgi:hypothetical protein